MSDTSHRDGVFTNTLTDLLRNGNDDETIAAWLNDHYAGDAPLIIEMLVARVRHLHDVMVEQLREWASLIEDDVPNLVHQPWAGLVAGMRDVASDLDLDRNHPFESAPE